MSAAIRNREFGTISEIAHMSGLLIGSRAVALMGLRTRRGLITGKVHDDHWRRLPAVSFSSCYLP